MNEQTRPTEGTSASAAQSTAAAPRVAMLLDAAAARLAKAGVDTARHDAKLCSRRRPEARRPTWTRPR